MVDTSRLWGGLLCLAILIVAILFLWGIFQQNYWALAIPVMIGFLGILGLAFWIGWTILTIKTVHPGPESRTYAPGGERQKSSSPQDLPADPQKF